MSQQSPFMITWASTVLVKLLGSSGNEAHRSTKHIAEVKHDDMVNSRLTHEASNKQTHTLSRAVQSACVVLAMHSRHAPVCAAWPSLRLWLTWRLAGLKSIACRGCLAGRTGAESLSLPHERHEEGPRPDDRPR